MCIQGQHIQITRPEELVGWSFSLTYRHVPPRLASYASLSPTSEKYEIREYRCDCSGGQYCEANVTRQVASRLFFIGI